MTFVVYNSQGIPVYSTDSELEAQKAADMEDGYYKAEP